jgi:hypothetical protein
MFSSASAARHRASAASFARVYLDRDALGSVFGFFTLRELAAAMRVNKEWNAAVQAMRPAMLPAADSFYLDKWGALFASPLRRHVGQLGNRTNFNLHMLSRQWRPLTQALPHLRALMVELYLVSDPSPVWHLPSQLQRLHVAVQVEHGKCEPPGHVDRLYSAICQLQQLHTLNLQLQYRAISLAPLQQLPNLRDLELHASTPDVAQFAAQLRALHWLHRLHIGLQIGPHDISATRAPQQTHVAALPDAASAREQPPLQWRHFHLEPLDTVRFTALSSLFVHMPLLERLSGDLSHCTEFAFLSALPKLTHLDMHVLHLVEDTWQNLLGVFTSDGLSRLRTLSLSGTPCHEDELQKLLSHTPSLTCLTLMELPRVTSLSFFWELPRLAKTLTELELRSYDRCNFIAFDLPSLHALQHLRVLRLFQWADEEDERLTAEDVAPFEQRPCKVLPRLEVFEWTTPCHC